MSAIQPFAAHARRRFFLSAYLFAFLTLGQAPLAAQPLPRFTVTEFAAREGAPSDVNFVEQTSDGYLWMATSTGLYRFDGVTFVRMQPPLFPSLPNHTVGGLQATEDGGLWVGARSRIFLIRHGKIVREDRLPPEVGPMRDIVADPLRGTIAVTANTLLHLEGDTWKKLVPDRAPFNQTSFFRAFPASDGSLWISTGAGMFKQARPNDEFVQRSTESDYGRFGETADGSIWYQQLTAGLQRFSATGGFSQWSQHTSGTMLITSEGVGLISSPEGLHVTRFPPTTKPDDGRGTPQPFSLSAVRKEMEPIEARDIIQDREGNFWAATYDGIVRLRPNRLREHEGLEGSGGLAAGPDGTLALISFERGLMLVDDSVTSIPQAGSSLTYIFRDSANTLWMGGRGRSGLLRWEAGKLSELPTPMVPSTGFVMAIAVDADGAPWFSAHPGGVHRWNGSAWQDRGGFEELPRTVRTFALDDEGSFWLGASNNHLFRIEDGKLTLFDEDDGIDVGTVSVIVTRNKALYAGGDGGITMHTASGFRKLEARNDNFLGVSSLILTTQGELWSHQSTGILRVTRAELLKAHADPSYKVEVERFDYRDGLVGNASQVPPLPSGVEAPDGSLWFSATNTVRINPAAIARNKVPPDVHVLTIDSGEGALNALVKNDLVLGSRDVTISFTATSLTDPAHVRFRHRLNGHDTKWRDVGALREASYTGLEPGTYLFEVEASNNDGLWSKQPGSISITVPAYFYEQAWFRIACVLVALFALWLAFHARSLQVAARVRERLKERALERERIARDLHDTLLQGVQGLVLQMQVISDRLPSGDSNRLSIESALDSADALIREGRERVSELKLADVQSDMGEYFRSIGAAFKGAEVTRLSVQETGRGRELQPMANSEVRRILSEALINALRHARASSVELTINYGERELVAKVEDDGCGIPADVLAAGGRPGHWGLSNMKERAHQLGGRVDIQSKSGEGTLFELRVPGSIAYRTPRKGWWARLPRMLGRNSSGEDSLD